MVSGNVNEVRWHVVPSFCLGKLHNLLSFCLHFAKTFANHALSEIILLRGEVGRITNFDVSSRVQEYMRTYVTHPLNIYEKQTNLVHLCYAPYTGKKIK